MVKHPAMDIQLDKPVLGNDGEQIGTVDRLIVDKETHKIREFLVKEGMILQTDRVVDAELVTHIDDDGTVHLSISSDEGHDLPAYVEDRYTTPADHELDVMPHVWATTGAGGGPLFWGPAGPDRGAPGEGSMFEPASANPRPIEPDPPVDQASVVVDEGTNVIDRDGESVGKVDEVFYNPQGEISALRVTSGIIFTKKIDVPIRWVDDIRPDAIQLNTTAQEAEEQGEVAE